MFERLERAYQQYRRKRSLASIRATMAIFGYDTAHISDDELEAKWLEFQQHLRESLPKVSVSAEQAGKSFENLGRAAAAMHKAMLKSSNTHHSDS